MGLAEMLAMAAMDNDRDEDNSPRILPEAVIARLREAGERYAEQLKGPRFQVGDIITPMKDTGYNGIDEPHLVLETINEAAPIFSSGEASSNSYGRRCDIRVLCFADEDTIAAYWVESFLYQLWTEDQDKKATPARRRRRGGSR